ncbi:hypothetical protein ACNTMW_18275 [Planosporangium sp. 12N6]|uniref:hypothetical protein n=1 Tax=Planosporangium spinosum TaxID=3402278 RepID=UPI003CE981B7
MTGAPGETDPMRVLAFVVADALLDRFTRDDLITCAARHGIPLAGRASDTRIRAAIRAHNRDRARRDGLPIDGLPTLTADEGLCLGRLLAGGDPNRPQPPTNRS